MLKARIIKKKNCAQCKSYLKALNHQKYDFLLYDADAEENQDDLDSWKVTKLPVVQIVDIKEDGTQEWVFQFNPGKFCVRTIDAKIKSLQEGR